MSLHSKIGPCVDCVTICYCDCSDRAAEGELKYPTPQPISTVIVVFLSSSKLSSRLPCFALPPPPPSDPSPQLKLLCGADFLNTFKIPGLWWADHVEELVGHFGLVCVSRGELQPERAVHESDTLSRHRHNIFHVREWVKNETSATEVRRALRRGLSVKYLVPDSVIEYIHQHSLYTEDSEMRNKGTVLRPLVKQAREPVKSPDE